MAFRRRIHFTWGASSAVPARWFLGTFCRYAQTPGRRADTIAFSVRALLVWFSGFGLVLYLVAATALFWLWQKNPYLTLRYSDALLYPIRRQYVSAHQGQALLAQGQELFRARKWHDASYLLRRGLARYPQDLPARLTLARYHHLLKQRATALQTLEAGLTDLYCGRAYLSAVFQAAEQSEDFELIARHAARYTAQLQREGKWGDWHWLQEQRFAASLAAGRPADALALAESRPTGNTAREQKILALLALGRSADALAALAAWRALPTAPVPVVVRLAARARREAGDLAGMERALAELRSLAPADPAGLVFAVVQQALAGRAAAARTALDNYVFRFGSSLENLLLVASPLAHAGHIELLGQLLAVARERGHPPARFQALLVPLHARRGEWDAAQLALAESTPPPRAHEPLDARLVREWLLCLVEAARAPASPAPARLLDCLRSFPWTPEVFRQSVHTLRAGGGLETAREVASLGTQLFPANRHLQALATSARAVPPRRPSWQSHPSRHP